MGGVNLEDYRRNSVGHSYFLLSKTLKYNENPNENLNCSIYIPDIIGDLSNIVIQEVEQELISLENKPIGGTSAKAPLVVVNIFSMLENIISTVQKVILFYSNEHSEPKNIEKDFIDNVNKGKFNDKLKYIFTETNNDIKCFYKTLEYKKLQELLEYRNNYLHGNLVSSNIKSFKHSNTVKQYYFSNFTDIIDALNTVVNIISIFRYILPKVDLMPQIILHKNKTCFYKPLDTYFEHVIYKAFCLTLKKLNLETRYKIEEKSDITLKQFKAKNLISIAPVIKAKPDKHDIYRYAKDKLSNQLPWKLYGRVCER